MLKFVSMLLAGAAIASLAHAQNADYRLKTSTPLGAPDRWDYVVFDAPSHRVYLAHGDHLAAFDAVTGALIGQVAGIAGGTHGVAVSGQHGFTDDGRNGEVIAFDPATLAITAHVKADKDADALLIDPKSGHLFVMEGDPSAVQVFDPKDSKLIATIPARGKVEYAAADGRGHVYVNGEEKREVLRIDTASNKIDGRFAVPDCASPHGLAMDREHRRLFVGCVNQVMDVVDADSGKIVATVPIGRGSDAIAFDPSHHRVFSSNGLDGTVTVIQQKGADTYAALAPLPTAMSGRTMDVDPKTGRLFVAAAETDPPATPNGRPRVRPGTLRLMVFDPAN